MKNNKLLYIFVIIMLTTCQMKTFGQLERVASAPTPDPILKTIVRHYQNDDVVSYVQTTRNSYFTLSNAMSFHKFALIKHNYVVNDMVIDKEYAYFCGVNTASNMGFIGYYNINDFFNGNDDYFIWDNLPTSTGFVAELNRMIVFNNRYGLNVAAIGHDNSLPQLSCIVDFLPWTTTGNNYSTGAVSSSHICPDFLDITCTDDYVVVSDMLGSAYIPSLRAFDKNNLFATGGIQNDVYTFGEFLDNMVYNYDDLLIEHIQSNLVVTTTYWKDLYSPNVSDETNFLVFDISAMLSSPYMGQLYSFGMRQPCTTGMAKLYELKNDPIRRCLCLLQRNDEPTAAGGIAYLVNEINYNTIPPVTPISGCYVPGCEFYSFDLFNSRFFSNGTDPLNRYTQKYHSKPFFLLGTCSQHIRYPYSVYHTSRNKRFPSPLSVHTTNISFAQINPRITENSISIECEQ